MAADLVQRIKWTFLSSLQDAPIVLQPFYRTITHKLDGLETSLFAIAQGVKDAVPEEMQIWHPDLAGDGYHSWARAYFARAEAAAESDLPDKMESAEQIFLEQWRKEVLALIDEAASAYGSGNAP